MSDDYDKPGTPSNAVYNSLNGHLLLIRPANFEGQVQTANGLRDAVRARIDVVDTGEVLESTLVFPRVLVTQLRDRIGGKVLGRLTQGSAKQGQNPPWMLLEATEDDKAQARAYEQRIAAGEYQAPAPQQGQPPQQPQQGYSQGGVPGGYNQGQPQGQPQQPYGGQQAPQQYPPQPDRQPPQGWPQQGQQQPYGPPPQPAQGQRPW